MSDATTIFDSSKEFRLIPLSGRRGRGRFTKVSAHRFAYLSQFTWHLATKAEYVSRTVKRDGKYSSILMHREIMGFPEGMDVDHKNGDHLDNADDNLRVATRIQNCANWQAKRKNATSQYFGVTFNKRMKKWIPQIVLNRKHVHLGHFDTEEEAVRVRDGAAIALQGEFAHLSAPHLDPIPYVPRPRRQHSSKFRGVTWHSQDRRWIAAQWLNGKCVRIGAFLDETEAARARDAFVRKHGLSRSKLNFPDSAGES